MFERPNYSDYLRGQESLPPLGTQLAKTYADLITTQRYDAFLTRPHANRVVKTLLDENILPSLALYSPPTTPYIGSILNTPYSAIKEVTSLEAHEWLVLQFSTKELLTNIHPSVIISTTKVPSITDISPTYTGQEIFIETLCDKVSELLPYVTQTQRDIQVERLYQIFRRRLVDRIGGDFFCEFQPQNILERYQIVKEESEFFKKRTEGIPSSSLSKEEKRERNKISSEIRALRNMSKYYLTPDGVALFFSIEAYALSRFELGPKRLAWVRGALEILTTAS